MPPKRKSDQQPDEQPPAKRTTRLSSRTGVGSATRQQVSRRTSKKQASDDSDEGELLDEAVVVLPKSRRSVNGAGNSDRKTRSSGKEVRTEDKENEGDSGRQSTRRDKPANVDASLTTPRKRGRPKKVVPEPEESLPSEDSGDEEDKEDEGTSARRPARYGKSVNVDASISTTRKRGRPKQVAPEPEELEESADSVHTEPEESPSKTEANSARRTTRSGAARDVVSGGPKAVLSGGRRKASSVVNNGDAVTDTVSAKRPRASGSMITYGKRPKLPSPAVSDDELLLQPSPSVSRVRKLSTAGPSKPSQRPPNKTPRTPGGSRHFLESVEIISPRKSSGAKASTPAKGNVRAVPSSPLSGKGKGRAPLSGRASSHSPVRSARVAKAGDQSATGPALPTPLPEALQPYFTSQKRAILTAINRPSLYEGEVEQPDTPLSALTSLLRGTVERGEGNSCLVLGPPGSGKTRAAELALSTLPSDPVVVRLSGLTHPDDRSALREMRRQILKSLGEEAPEAPDDNAEDDEDEEQADAPFASLPPLPRPLIVILSEFDVFCMRPRQALLYVLLDAVQSLRGGSVGIAVVGVSCRIDCVNLLEKRVKSRFSHRIIRVSPPQTEEAYVEIARRILSTPLRADDSSEKEEWSVLWKRGVEAFLTHKEVLTMLRHTWELVQDIRLLQRILIHVVVHLSVASPWPSPSHLSAAISAQRGPQPYPYLKDLALPALTLLIAAYHAGTAGHDTFTFEQLEHSYRAFARDNSASVTAQGQLPIPREALLAAFDELVDTKMFAPAALPFAPTMREFTRYRCCVERNQIKDAVTKGGSTGIRRWLTKWAQG